MNDMQRLASGSTAYHAGAAAEEAVERHYLQHGYTLAHRRWRGRGGEIDLVLRRREAVVFVEVKKSSDFARAAQRLAPAQIRRLLLSAEDFLGREPKGALTECRFDVALVDASGACSILRNALGQG
ncbi:YraN family protein [Sulfitobacter sp. D35]|uniref:YraN family protein n=1 Tax=Sulfitobacter sp. D35 TaxID=3083252 RepID=UPI00296EAED1|nr:YraN family protein [Sulfitobacter sp. D35]MDW4499007.1 YraN family protein [Sulfitobacter sp. D35]